MQTRLIGAGRLPIIGGFHQRLPGDSFRNASHQRSLLRPRARQQCADFARRRAHCLHPPAGQQDRGPLGFLAVDHERRWQPASLPDQGLRSALVVGREAHPLYRRWRAARPADLRPLDRCRWARHAGHARHRQSGRRALVAGRQIHRVLHVRAGKRQLEDQHAARARRRQVDGRAAHGGNAALPPGSGWIPRRRAHASVRRLGRWRRAAPDHQRQVERGRRRIARRCSDGLDARQQGHRV